MRLALAATALCLSFLVLAAVPATPQAPAPEATSPSVQVANDAAARHAKRTSCLKEAKSRKLIGTEKTAFLKHCIEAPPEAVSANRISPPDKP
ncbi:MAG TPA: hypothetical protein VGN99_03660 [Steroidobacteraceae bacterium]|jgi:hypothetical protein|nr:hypothetical protein [Steroidobacteraceae bacterium]